MRIDILTIFPEMFPSVLGTSMLGRAAANGILDFRVHNIRDYSLNKHHNTDDYPYGGGAGMVMMAQPIMDCIDAVSGECVVRPRRILMTPRGRTLSTELARELSGEDRLLILAGHYEGIDERVMELIDDEISVGDYVLTGGELPALVLIDCLSRFVPGVLGSSESAEDESFSCSGLLEYPQYTRPSEYRGLKVPEVLLNGNHAEIRKWRRQESIVKTVQNRPDILEKAELTDKERLFIESLSNEQEI